MVAYKVPLCAEKLILLQGVAVLDCLRLLCREERHKLQWQEGPNYFASLVMGSKNVYVRHRAATPAHSELAAFKRAIGTGCILCMTQDTYPVSERAWAFPVWAV